jgi:hypothetical protein
MLDSTYISRNMIANIGSIYDFLQLSMTYHVSLLLPIFVSNIIYNPHISISVLFVISVDDIAGRICNKWTSEPVKGMQNGRTCIRKFCVLQTGGGQYLNFKWKL